MCALAEDPANLPMANEMVAVLHTKHKDELQLADVRKAISKVELAQSGDEGSGATLEQLRAQLDEEPLRHAVRLELAQMLMKRDESEAAMNELLLIIRKTVRKKDDAEAAQAATDAKEYLFKVFDALGMMIRSPRAVAADLPTSCSSDAHSREGAASATATRLVVSRKVAGAAGAVHRRRPASLHGVQRGPILGGLLGTFSRF